MASRSLTKQDRSTRATLAGVGYGILAGLFFVLIDIIVCIFILCEGTFPGQLFLPVEIWVRSFIFVITLAFSIAVARLRFAREELKESEERYRVLAEAAHDVVFVVDKEDRVRYMNENAASIIGEKPENLIGRERASLFPSETAEWQRRSLQEVFRTGRPVYVEDTIRYGDRLTWQGAWLVPLAGEKGAVESVMGVSRDITERRRVEEALRASEKKLSDITSALGEGVYVLDEERRVIFVNPEAERLLGWSAEELIGETIHEKIHFKRANGRELPADECPVIGVIDSGETRRTDHDVFVHKDGIVFPVATVTTPIKEDGRVVAVVTAFQDITRRKRVEEESAFRSLLLDSAIDPIIVHDFEGKILYANEAAWTSKGYTREELLGMRLYDLVVADGHDFVKEQLAVLAQTGDAKFETTHRKKDGELIRLDVHSRVVEHGGEKVIIGVERDITERTRMLEIQHRAKELSDSLNEINAAINSTLDFDKIMGRVVVDACRAIGCDAATVCMRVDDRWTFRHVYGLPQRYVGAVFDDKDAPHLAMATRNRAPFVVNDMLADERFDRDEVERSRIRSVLTIPLIARETVIGAICFQYLDRPRVFSDTQIDFAGKLAVSVSLAAENARLYAVERNIADTLQQALLTVPERIEGIDFAHLYRSATEATEVGGDFYDLFELEHDRVGIVIGDVSGKGLEAATLTSLVKNTVKAYAHEDTSLALVMSKTNHLVKEASEPSAFATVFFGILNTLTGRLVFCSAGHPRPLVVKENAPVECLATRSPIVGAFDYLPYIEESVVLGKGDILVLYTDGVTESRRDGDFFGEERLIETVEGRRNESPVDLARDIFIALQEYTGGSFSDDMAVLIIRRAEPFVEESEDARVSMEKEMKKENPA